MAKTSTWTRLASKVESIVHRRYVPELAVCLLIVGYVVVFSFLTIRKHQAYLTYAYDLGLYQQMISSTLHGEGFFTTTIDFPPPGFHLGMVRSYFQHHTEFILLLVLPFYALHPAAETLLVFQTIVISLGALPLYWLASRMIGKGSGIIFVFLYLIYPANQWMNWYDFHSITIAPLFLLAAYYCLRKNKYLTYGLFTFLSLLVVEEMSLAVVSVGLYWVIIHLRRDGTLQSRQKAIKVGLLTIICGLAWLVVSIEVIQYFSGGMIFQTTLRNYHVSSGMVPLVVDILSHPIARVYFIFQLLAPLAFQSLTDIGSALMGLPILLLNLAGSFPQYSLTVASYNAAVIPFVFVSAVQGIAKMSHKARRSLLLIMIVAGLMTSLMWTPVVLSGQGIPVVTSHDLTIDRVIQLMPKTCNVSTENDLVPHVLEWISDPLHVYAFYIRGVDFILVDTTSYYYAHSVEGPAFEPVVVQLLSNHSYGLYSSEDGILLLERGYNGTQVNSTIQLSMPFSPNLEQHQVSIVTQVSAKHGTPFDSVEAYV